MGHILRLSIGTWAPVFGDAGTLMGAGIPMKIFNFLFGEIVKMCFFFFRNFIFSYVYSICSAMFINRFIVLEDRKYRRFKWRHNMLEERF